MKKLYIFLASAALLAFAACERTEMEAPVAGDPAETTTLTLAFDATRTQLVDGKTAWAAGDKVRILNSDGKYTVDVEVPADQDGKTSFDVEVSIKDTAYFAVYPVSAAEGIADNKVQIRIPSSTSGRFADANICAAKAVGTTLSMRNVTSVLKLNVNSGNVVEMLQIASKNALVGAYSVDLSGEAPALAAVANDTTKSVTVAVGGVDGDYFVAAAPVEIDPGLSITALRGNGGYQTLTSGVKNTLAINKIFDLGVIGDNLTSGLTGEGTESNPFLLTNAGEFGAFAASVNLGKSYEDQYVSLQCDMVDNPVTTPIGFYISDDEQAPFSGHFLGNNHKIKVDLDGINSKDPKGQHYVALFGELGAGSSIADLEVEGVVKADGNYAAGVVGSSEGSSAKRVSLTNIKANVAVTSKGNYIGGVAGYAGYTDIKDCDNSGAVTGNNTVAGVSAYNYNVTLTNCHNTAAIKSTATAGTGMFFPAGNNYSAGNYPNGSGGVAGWTQNSKLNNCSNTASVEGFNKVGGVVGVTYWTDVDGLTNSGNVTGNGYYEGSNISGQMEMGLGSAAGGVIGWVHTAGKITNCSNSGKVVGKLGIGGIIGIANGSNSATPSFDNLVNTGEIAANTDGTGKTFPRGIGGHNPGTGGIIGSLVRFGNRSTTVSNCRNSGKVTSVSVNTGGIIGLMHDHGNLAKPAYSYILQCVNEGDVTGGPFRVGGIVGYSFCRFVGRLQMKNCANHGTITGTRPTSGGTVAGGIIGGLGSNSTNATYRNTDQLWIHNCYNDGDVVYSTASLTDPYVGGIAGYLWGNTYFQNNYNGGYVGPADKSAPATDALKYLGGLAGLQYQSYVHYSYSSNEVLNGQMVGSAGTANRTDTVCSFDPADGTLAINITANNKVCDKLMDALNEWQNYSVGAGNVYYNWTGEAGHPVFADTMD